jgi:hypothetical protein
VEIVVVGIVLGVLAGAFTFVASQRVRSGRAFRRASNERCQPGRWWSEDS